MGEEKLRARIIPFVGCLLCARALLGPSKTLRNDLLLKLGILSVQKGIEDDIIISSGSTA